MKIESAAFKHSENVPQKYSCEGSDVNPPLTISDVPAGTKSLALIMDDPDAPVGTWVHWLVWNITPQTKELKENAVPVNAVQGKNSWGRSSYGGPCPPGGTHRYFFKVYALDCLLSLTSSADVKQLEKALQTHVLAEASLMGKYSRK